MQKQFPKKISCISLKHWSFSSHPNSDIQWLLLFIKTFCSRWEMSGCDSWMRMRCGIGDQLWHCSNLKTEHKDKLAKKLPSPSLFYSSLNTNTDSPRNNNTRMKERCLSAHGVILCHCVTVMFRPAWLVSVRGTWGAREWQTHTHTHTLSVQHAKEHRWCKGFCSPLQFLIDIILSSWLQILA